MVPRTLHTLKTTLCLLSQGTRTAPADKRGDECLLFSPEAFFHFLVRHRGQGAHTNYVLIFQTTFAKLQFKEQTTNRKFLHSVS